MSRHFYVCYKYGGGGGGDWGGELIVCGEFGAVTDAGNGSHWEARPPPEGLQGQQSHGFLEENSDAGICPEGPVPMDAGQHLALGKQQSE